MSSPLRALPRTINYTTEDIRERVRDITKRRGVDVIYDPVGGDIFDSLLRCLAFEGRLVVIGFASGKIPQARAGLILIKNCAVVGSSWTTTLYNRPEIIAQAYQDIFRWYEAGQLHPHISHTLPFEQAPQALALLADRKALGKIVLTAS
jgi:NADPH2:quinone reductase